MFNIEPEIKATKVRLCLDCGKCTVVCPVAQYDSEFNPRRIIQKRLGQGAKGKTDDTIWSCLSCHMCYERCNFRVKFPDFVHSLRAEAVSQGAEVQCSHGGVLQSVMRMMARQDLKQERLDWLPEDISLEEQSDTRFFVGCAPYFDVLFKDLEVRTLEGVVGSLRLLNKAGIPFNLLANERCCGRDLLLAGDLEGFTSLAKANLAEFNRHGVKQIISYCPECYTTLKIDYPRILGETGIEVISLMEVLASGLKDGKLGKGNLEKTVTYHDPCALGRGMRIFDTPRELLKTAGTKVVEMEYSRERALCCGASPWVHCSATNRQIQGQRLNQAQETGAEVLVTACPKCQIHLKCAQKCGNCEISGVEIQDLASLVAGSLNRR